MKKAFTLIELVVVVSILIILGLIVGAVFVRAAGKSGSNPLDTFQTHLQETHPNVVFTNVHCNPNREFGKSDACYATLPNGQEISRKCDLWTCY